MKIYNETRDSPSQVQQLKPYESFRSRIYSCNSCSELIDLFTKVHVFDDYDIIDENFSGVYYMIPIKIFEEITDIKAQNFHHFCKYTFNDYDKKYIICCNDHISITNIVDYDDDEF